MIILLCSLFGYGYAQQVLDKIIAIVDDEVILESQVTQSAYYSALQMGIDPTKNPGTFEELKKQTLQNLVHKELLLIQADKDTVEADESTVDNYLQNDLQRITQQVGGEEKIEETLGMPISKFRRVRRDEIEKELRVNMVRDKKFANVTVSRRDVERYFKTHKDSLGVVEASVDISHILVTAKAGEKSRQDAMSRIKEIQRLVRDDPSKFSELAKEYSEDPGSATNGGDLGFVPRSTFVREFAEAASKLEPGEISDIVETQFGFHIIKLLEKRGDKIHTQHILVTIKPSQQDELDAVAKIKKIHQDLVDGADFVELVKEYSEDESSNAQEGHLGRFPLSQLRQMAKEFSYAINGIEPGQITDPVKTQFGYHIIKVNDRQPERPYDLEKDWDQIEKMALQAKKDKEFKDWITRIEDEVYVEIKEPYSSLIY